MTFGFHHNLATIEKHFRSTIFAFVLPFVDSACDGKPAGRPAIVSTTTHEGSGKAHRGATQPHKGSTKVHEVLEGYVKGEDDTPLEATKVHEGSTKVHERSTKVPRRSTKVHEGPRRSTKVHEGP